MLEKCAVQTTISPHESEAAPGKLFGKAIGPVIKTRQVPKPPTAEGLKRAIDEITIKHISKLKLPPFIYRMFIISLF